MDVCYNPSWRHGPKGMITRYIMMLNVLTIRLSKVLEVLIAFGAEIYILHHIGRY